MRPRADRPGRADGTAPGRLHRIGVLVVLVGLVVAAAVFDRPADTRAPGRIPDRDEIAQVGAATFGTPTLAERNQSMPVAAGLGAASTTWFCGGSPAAATTLVLTNRAATGRTVTVSGFTDSGSPVDERVAVPGHSTRNLAGDFAGEGNFAAIVESRHGGIVATQRIAGEDTATTAACASSTSASWFFAGGDTLRGSAETLVLFNPFDELATADVTFLTPDGFRRPQATQGLAVPSRSVVAVDVGSVQDRRSDLGAAVTTRAGQLVTWRHQTHDGSGEDIATGAPARGVSVALGAPTPLKRFALPTAVTGEGVAPRLVLANPGVTTATVELEFAIDNPAQNGQPPPTSLELLPGAVEVLGAEELRQIAAGVPFSVSGQVTEGGAIVTELHFDGAEPAAGHGAFATTGYGLSALAWVSPVGLELPELDQLGITSAGEAAEVRLWSVVDGERRRLALGDQPMRVPASGRITIDLSVLLEAHPGAAVEVTASSPVTISRLQAGPDARGLVSTPAVPIAGGLAAP